MASMSHISVICMRQQPAQFYNGARPRQWPRLRDWDVAKGLRATLPAAGLVVGFGVVAALSATRVTVDK